MPKVTLQGYIIVGDSDLNAVIAELDTHKALTLAEQGCIVFRVIVDEVNKNKFNVYEEFVNQAAFDAHQARIKSSTWAKVTKDVERHYQISRED
jgi:quinol monooxygenase YgiN